LINPSAERDVLLAEAMRLYELGDQTAAEEACRGALRASPDDPLATSLLGAVLLAQQRYAEASAVLAELIEHEPQERSHWLNLGTAYRGLGRLDQALAAYGHAASLGPSDVGLLFNLGLTHLDRNDYASARAVLEKAHGLDPDDPEVCLRYAQACYHSLHNDEAVAVLRSWRALASLTPPAVLAQIAQLLVNLGEQREGQAALEAALAHPQADALALLTAIETLERVNRLDEARASLTQLESQPRSALVERDLLIVRARLAQRFSDHATALRLYRQSIPGTDEALRFKELFPLAQSLDAMGSFDEAWATLLQAHHSQLLHLRRVAPALVLTGPPPMLITQHSCDPADVAAWRDGAPALEESPVFIVAFPRSGTTLLEISLDAHPALKSMDEQGFIQSALQEMQELCDYPSELSRLNSSDLAGLRARYWQRAASKVELKPGVRLVDKNPLNILRLPVIRRLFPHAPILLGLRHPCDVILSCYMQVFRAPEFALLCNTLRSLTLGYRRTMDFWVQQVQILAPRAREVRYESLVSDFEREMRSLIDFLELPWDERVLRPAEHARNKGFISTPSYAQVVRPVSTRSVDRWQHYAGEFAPILPVIEPVAERWNYSTVVAVDGVSPNSR
jgi:tetratricopeptide (TPR) repeat protein